MNIIKRILIAIITSLILSMASMFYNSEPHPNLTGFIVFTIFSIIFLVPNSILIDFIFSKFFTLKINSYLFKLISYTIIGVLYAYINDVALKGLSVLSFILFFHIYMILRKPLRI